MVAIVCDSIICELTRYSSLETPDSKYTVTTGRFTDPEMQNALKKFVSCA